MQVVIPRRSQSCAHGGEVLTPGSEYYSVLVDKEDEGIIRHDYCTSCWGAVNGQAVKRSHWKSSVPVKPVAAKEAEGFSDKEYHAMELFKKALAGDTVEDRAEAFILALFLSRQRFLHRRQQVRQKDGSVVYIYETADSEEAFYVPVVNLRSVQAEVIQKRLTEKLLSNG